MVQLSPIQFSVQIHNPGDMHVPPLLQYSVQLLLATTVQRKRKHIRHICTYLNTYACTHNFAMKYV